MTTCPNCNELLGNEVEKCPYCGKSFPAVEKPASFPHWTQQKEAQAGPFQMPLRVHALISIFLILSIILCASGIYKFTAYEKPETSYLSSDKESHNVYVEGDAYNLIISAGQGIGFFVISMGCLIPAVLCGIWGTVYQYTQNKKADGIVKNGIMTPSLGPGEKEKHNKTVFISRQKSRTNPLP